MPPDTNTTTARAPIMLTPTAQLTALYAEYDSLLDSLDALRVQLRQAERCRNHTKRNEVRTHIHAICEALADVHERIAEYHFVIMTRSGM